MKTLFYALALVCASQVVLDTPAYACNASWKKGQSPRDVRQKPSVRKIAGTYTLVEVAGNPGVDENGGEIIENAKFIGELRSKSGKIWKTTHQIFRSELTCVDVLYSQFRKPEGDAKGTFWLRKVAKDGRYELLDWEGEYLPEQGDPTVTKE